MDVADSLALVVENLTPFTRIVPRYNERVDPLVQSDIEIDRTLTPADKLAQAFEMNAAGIRLKQAALRLRHPKATDAEIAAMITAWLFADD